MPRDREFALRQGRFKDLVLYISTVLDDDPTFGSTKLNKILYFSDTDAYLRFGEPITGAKYQKNRYGPTAREYLPLVGELEQAGYVTVQRKRVVDHEQDVVTPTGEVEPNMAQFTDAERAIIDARIAEFREYTNTEASDESHKRVAGWQAMNLFETIPYSTAIVSLELPDDEIVSYFEELESRTAP